MRVAIVHYWLVGMRGGEKVIEALCNLFPQADIFTHVHVPESISPIINRHKITTTFINKLPRARYWYKKYLALMPLALEQLDLRGYDLIISSESGPAKGIVPAPGSVHVCYCHSPMRYIWNMYHEYRSGSGPLMKGLMIPASHYLRLWDTVAAGRVDDFVANSHTVACRIHRYYGREATVIPPPVDLDAFEIVSERELGDFYLMVGELVPYKRPDLAIQAFNKTRQKLIVIGGGEMLGQLKDIAGPTIQILGPQPFGVLRYHYARCRALIFPGEEDFGMVPVETMASGRPVIAYARGGATETVIPGLSGILFHEQSPDAIIDALFTASQCEFVPAAIAAHSKQFSVDKFSDRMLTYVNAVLRAQASKPVAGTFRRQAWENRAWNNGVDSRSPDVNSSSWPRSLD